MLCAWILPKISFDKRREFFVLACWCSVPAHPPEGEREQQTTEFHSVKMLYSKFHLVTTTKILCVASNRAILDN